MKNLLIKLADILDLHNHMAMSNNIDMIIKQSYVLEFYHGTSSRFLHNVLKEGLITNPREKVWAENYKRDTGHFGFESYPGAYISNNFMTAYASASNAIRKFGGNRLIVAGKVETRTPEARIDEDHISQPGIGVAIKDRIVSDWHKIVNMLDYNAFDINDNEIKHIATTWIKDSLRINPTEELIKRAIIVTKKWLEMSVALQVEKEQSGDLSFDNMLNRLKKRFGENIPKKYLDVNNTIQDYRKAMDDFLAKAKELLSSEKTDKWMTNLRLVKPIAYKGANKIEAVIEINKNDNLNSGTEIIVHYSSNSSSVVNMLENYKKSIGPNFIVK